MQTEPEINSNNYNILKPRKALNKAFLKVKPNRSQIEEFKINLTQLLDRTNDTESEEFHKNLVIDFLKKTYYDPKHFINTKGRNDLVIHNGNKAKSTVGVIIEAKKPTNRAEMITKEKINVKAFQELVLYYLRERITQKNLEVKFLIATNINEWFIFDANIFEKAFAQNKRLVKQFEDFEAGTLAGKTTDFFYKEIAEPFIAQIKNEIEFTHFEIRSYEKPLRNNNPKDDNKLITLFKLFSPEHLLKLPFTNDSNSLDKRFYGELLHIIGLTETKQGGKKVIERQKDGHRNTGSFLENAIIQLDSTDKISRLVNPSQFGENHQERLFNVGLELSITWLNRILFLKLLEAQLVTYHKGDRSYEFLSLERIHNYDDLNSLFFQVLARQYEERNEDVKALFNKVPYLNSSLFEPTDIEHTTLFISNLRDDKVLPIYSSTVLKDKKGKKRSGEINALEYLFEFLNSYDFSSEGGETIQEDNKTLINASVLGLIFEKINGYKDGSFFTPGFITMYMCRETIRKAVVQKFNETKNWDCKDLDELYDCIEDRKEANEVINSLKICDPAVGSGHFLVSALNEIIAIKNDLNILQDRSGRRLKEYQVEVVNDELIVTDEEGELFEYNPTAKESQRIQEALFHEKQQIIENCLFGVDINPNSVKICRLRLWIELLKNAYYKNETELETLPNIDINIKCGNSLISRFDLDADLSKALKDSKWSIDSYRLAVDTYRNAENKEQKREMEKIIHDIKNDFRSEISSNDPKVKRLQKVKGEIYMMSNQTQMFEMSKREKASWNKKLKKFTTEAGKLETQIQEIKNNKIYENAFEWRFEFPEVLNEDGNFIGFDVVIGNPPYGIKFEKAEKGFIDQTFQTIQYNYESYTLFHERSIALLKNLGHISFITPNTFLVVENGDRFRKFFYDRTIVLELTETLDVFDDAVVETAIYVGKKECLDNYSFKFRVRDRKKDVADIKAYPYQEFHKTEVSSDDGLILNYRGTPKELRLNFKLKSSSKPLGTVVKINSGVILYEVGKGNPKQTKETLKKRPYTSPIQKGPDWKPLIKGGNIRRYRVNWDGEYVKYGSNLGAPRDPDIFLGEKIFLRRTDDKLMAAMDLNSMIGVKSVHIINTSDNEIPLSSILGVLNSKLMNWCFRYTHFHMVNKPLAEVKVAYVRRLPFKRGELLNQVSKIAEKVQEILKENPAADTSSLEAEIDRLVYELYGLTEEEIGIVEEVDE